MSACNEDRAEVRFDGFCVDLRRRIRNVRRCPGGLLFVLAEEDDGALLKLEGTVTRMPSRHERPGESPAPAAFDGWPQAIALSRRSCVRSGEPARGR